MPKTNSRADAHRFGTHIHKFGFNGDIGTVEETVWDVGGLYNYISTPVALNISSTNSADGTGNDGARTVQVYGLDASFNEINETVTLSGNTAISTVNTFARVYRGIVRTAGNSEGNIGIVYAGTGTTSDNGFPQTAHMAISSGQNQTLMAVFTIPANKTGYMFQLDYATMGNATDSITTRLLARPENEVFQTKDKLILHRGGGLSNMEHLLPMPFDEKTDLEIRGAASANTLDLAAGFTLALVDNN